MIRNLFIFALVSLSLATVRATAATTTTRVQPETVIEADLEELDIDDVEETDFDVEASLGINTKTQTTDSAPLLGATFLFRPSFNTRLGLRFSLPTSADGGEGASIIELPVRYIFKPSRNTLFTELSIGTSRYAYQNDFIGGVSVGVLYKISETLAIGGTGGIFVEPRQNTFYPRLTALVSAGI